MSSQIPSLNSSWEKKVLRRSTRGTEFKILSLTRHDFEMIHHERLAGGGVQAAESLLVEATKSKCSIQHSSRVPGRVGYSSRLHKVSDAMCACFRRDMASISEQPSSL